MENHHFSGRKCKNKVAIKFAIRGAGSSAPWLSIGLAGLGLAAGVSALRTYKALVNMACADAKHVSGR